jgi:hypothetical protein
MDPTWYLRDPRRSPHFVQDPPLQRLGSYRGTQELPRSPLPEVRGEHVCLFLQGPPRLYRTCLIFSSVRCSYTDNQFVEDNQGVVFFKNAAGVAQKYAVEEGGNISDSGIDCAEFKDE